MKELVERILKVKLPEESTGLNLFFEGRCGQNTYYIVPEYDWGTDGQDELLTLTKEEGDWLKNQNLPVPTLMAGFMAEEFMIST